MPALSEASLHCLALHLASRTFSEKNRRLLESAGTLPRLAQILLANHLGRFLKLAQETLNLLADDSVVTLADGDYPQILYEISTAPFALFLRGNRRLIATEKVSIVGTREPSSAGRIAAQNVAKYFISKGRVIVSGIARGIDAVVHHAALQAGGATIAVLPNGFDHLYPLENRDIYELSRTSDRILLISEYPPNEKPQRYQFVRRNRIIAGLSPLTVVIEAGAKSGAMITVNHALEQGRDVAALSHHSLANNAGGEQLVADGAINLTAIAFATEAGERLL